MLHAANNKARAANDTEKMDDVSNPIFAVNGDNYYGKTIAAKPERNGKIEAIVSYLDRIDALELDTFSLQWTSKVSQSGESLPNNPNDMIYVSGADQYLFVDGSNVLHTAKPDSKAINYIAITVKDDVNVTGVNANDEYIAVGMSDGTMYYTDNKQITRDTVWTQVPDMKSGEPIKNIEFVDGNNFVALSDTKIYKGSLVSAPAVPEVTVPTFGDVTSQGDDFWAKTATFTLMPNGNTNINVKVKVNDQEQTKTIENIESNIKFGIIVIGDDETAVDEARVIASASVE